MQFAIGVLIGASLGCSFGYVLGAIMRTGKQADVIDLQLERSEREPELPLAMRKSAA
jgi:NhaP-type Na+/H+ or K+/H+ antiporter